MPVVDRWAIVNPEGEYFTVFEDFGAPKDAKLYSDEEDAWAAWGDLYPEYIPTAGGGYLGIPSQDNGAVVKVVLQFPKFPRHKETA